MSSAGGTDDGGAHLVRALLLDLLLNMTVPLAIYELARRAFASTEFAALAWATGFPALKAIDDYRRRRELDPITILVLVGIGVSAVSLTLGGSPRLLLIRESFATGAFGLLCFVSLLGPRPLMFYLGRHFVAGPDPRRRARYEASWRYADVRRSQRLVTAVWGLVFWFELGFRVYLAYHLPAAAVLVLAPVVMAALVVGTILWTFRLVARVQRSVVARLDAVQPAPGHTLVEERS